MIDETPPIPLPTFELMKRANRWLLANPSKVPLYISGHPRSGKLDSPEETLRLGTYDQAVAALATKGEGWNLGFALGPDGTGNFWQGIDYDHVAENGLSDLANTVPGYVEKSRSGKGAHAVGYGRCFAALGANSSGIEAYSGGRYFVVTEQPIRDGGVTCLADHVEQVLAPRHGGKRNINAPTGPDTYLPPQTVTHLRSALFHLRADDRVLWVNMGLALKETGEIGRGIWLDWSQHSGKYQQRYAASTWDSFKPNSTGYQAVFAEAQRQGWINPMSNAAQIGTVAPSVSAAFHNRTPRNFLTTASAPALDLANVPQPIAQFAAGYSSAFGFDQSGIVMAAIAAAAAMIHDEYVLEVKRGWYVSARLWTVLIGKSATGKSPTIKAATAPVKLKHGELVACFYASPDRENDPPDGNPPEPAIYTSDTTIEALSEKLRHNPRGMLMLTEEFSSWIGAIDSSGRGEAAKNRGNWLQLYDGGSYQVDRIKRGSALVPNWGASVLTATTPSSLAEHMKHLPEDGLIQRFIPVILERRNFAADGDAQPTMDKWRKALHWIFNDVKAAVIRMSDEAAQLFKTIEAELGRAAGAMDDISPALASHIGKQSEMIARIALVFHVFEGSTGNSVLSAATLQKAVNLMDQLRKHSVALYTDILGRSPATEVARALAHSIAAADPSLATIGRDWMTQHCRAFAQAKDDRARREAVQLLEDLDWLHDASTRTYGGWPTKLEVNRSIFRLYAREGEVHRAKRAAVQAIFGNTPDV